MSLLKKCDICGMNEETYYLKDDNKTRPTFTKIDQPIMIRMKNNKGDNYNIVFCMSIEKKSDTDKVDKYLKLMSECEDDFISAEDIDKERLGLENPNPLCCDDCYNKILQKLILQ